MILNKLRMSNCSTYRCLWHFEMCKSLRWNIWWIKWWTDRTMTKQTQQLWIIDSRWEVCVCSLCKSFNFSQWLKILMIKCRGKDLQSPTLKKHCLTLLKKKEREKKKELFCLRKRIKLTGREKQRKEKPCWGSCLWFQFFISCGFFHSCLDSLRKGIPPFA